MTEIVRETAHAKINPYLRVIRRRPDGYHEIETLILPITLADHVAVEPRDRGFPLRVSGPFADRVPVGEDNLAVQAARAMAAATGAAGGANILVEKHVPVAAGLGGGSADAAAVLRALNRLWRANLSVEELAAIGADVGSDVPALVYGRPVIARGRGDVVEPVDIPRTFWLLIAPDIEISAGDAYRWSRRVDRRFRRAPSLERLIEVLQRGNIEQAGPLLHNDLARGVRKRHPAVDDAERDLLRGGPEGKGFLTAPGSRRGAIGAVMSGSGPAVASLWADQTEARKFSTLLRATHAVSITAADA